MRSTYEPGTTLNSRPHPRVAVVSWSDDFVSMWTTKLRDLASTVDVFDSTSSADWSEYDAVFTNQNPVDFQMRDLSDEYEPPRPQARWNQNFAAHLDLFIIYGDPHDSGPHVVGVWPEECDDDQWTDELPDDFLRVTGRVKGRHVTRVDGHDADLARAVDQALTDVAKARDGHVIYEVVQPEGWPTSSPTVRPLLLGPSHKPLAVTWQRESGASVWVLPEDSSDLTALVRAAFAEWHVRDPDRYPPIPDWDHDDRYRTAAELDLLRQIAEQNAAFEQQRADHEATTIELLAQLEQTASTDGNARRALLRADKDHLAKAVETALVDLGFHVQDMDQVNTTSRREDFRITDPDDPDWTAVCEVKGYARGAGVDILRQVEHHATLYAAAEHKVPAKWAIVNAQRLQAPDTRETPYISRTDDIGTLESTGGLVIDTRALFQALQLVESQTTPASEVRATLRDTVGVMAVYPPPK